MGLKKILGAAVMTTTGSCAAHVSILQGVGLLKSS